MTAVTKCMNYVVTYSIIHHQLSAPHQTFGAKLAGGEGYLPHAD